MSVIQGKVHEKIGMTLEYTVRCQVGIIISSYIEEILNAFEKADLKGKGTESSAASNNVFFVNKDYNNMDQERVMEFHNIATKTLYTTRRARPDI